MYNLKVNPPHLSSSSCYRPIPYVWLVIAHNYYTVCMCVMAE